jgi:heat shock protein HtpX
MFYSSVGGSRRRYSSNGGGGQAQAIMMAIAIIAAILAPIMTQLLYFALSRKREYLADAGGARLTRYPEGLASALEKIANDRSPQLAVANKATAPMYIANPFKRKGQHRLADLTSTHPPISERVKILRRMSGASYVDYSKAFTQTTGSASVIPGSGRKQKGTIPLRSASSSSPKATTQKQQIHLAGDIMRAVNGFAFLACACGLKLKVPPNFKASQVKCPRCQTVLDVKNP